MKQITLHPTSGLGPARGPRGLRYSPWPSSGRKNAWNGGSIPAMRRRGCHHMPPPLPGAAYARGVCGRTLSTAMLKTIPLSDSEIGNMVEGTALQNMDCQRTSCGPEQSSPVETYIIQNDNIGGPLRSLFLWGDILEFIEEC